MGYKSAGYKHLGGVEIDPKVAACYEANHHPEHMYVMDLRKFNAIPNDQLPPELFTLDLLDGSPPCSTFSMAGKREKAWGKEKRFAEGQALQTLDDLVFVYCDTIAKLRPKVCLLENVSGIIKGNAKSYALRIRRRLNEIGYRVQVFLLNAASMGVPQTRERVFFIGLRNDIDLPLLNLSFNEKPIILDEIIDRTDTTCTLTDYQLGLWQRKHPKDDYFGDMIQREENRISMFSNPVMHSERVCPTVTTSGFDVSSLFDLPRRLNDHELKAVGTFPQDYQPVGKQLLWMIGMSVPPVMIAQISYQIYKQWLSKL